MAEEIIIDTLSERPRTPWWQKPRNIALVFACVMVIAAAFFSWWLANGTVSSLQARMDTAAYIVEPDFKARVRGVLVRPGQDVQSGQVIGTLEAPQEGADGSRQAGLQDITDRLGAIQTAERQLAQRAQEARLEEERLRKNYQDFVTAHVRTQLALRAMQNPNSADYRRMAAAETDARLRAQAANDEFEKASKARAAVDVELNKIRAQLQRARRGLSPQIMESAMSGQSQALKTVDLYAPVSGRVMRVAAEPGQIVDKGQGLLAIVPTGDDYLTNCWIQALFPADARKDLKPGQEALVRFEGLEPLKGKVKSAGGGSEKIISGGERRNTNNNYTEVQIVLDDPFKAAVIEPGAKAECQVQTRSFMGLSFF